MAQEDEFVTIVFPKLFARKVKITSNGESIPMYRVRFPRNSEYHGYTFLVKQEYAKDDSYGNGCLFFGSRKDKTYRIQKRRRNEEKESEVLDEKMLTAAELRDALKV